MPTEDPVLHFTTLAYFLNLSVFLTEHVCLLLRKSQFLVQESDKWGLEQKKKLKMYVTEFFWVMTPCSFAEDHQRFKKNAAFYF